MKPGGWTLTDHFEPQEETDEPWRETITSAGQLRAELERLAALEPRIAELETPDGRIIRIGIGGPWGGFGVIEGLPAVLRLRIARARTSAPIARVEFLYWQQPSSLRAEQLFPVAEAVDLVVDFFQSGRFPEWLGWDQS